LFKGLASLAGIVSFSAINYYRHGSKIRPSVYVIQTRVAAQGAVILALTGVVAYNMLQTLWTGDQPSKHHETALNYSEYHKDKKPSDH
jgi:hypothetical protein